MKKRLKVIKTLEQYTEYCDLHENLIVKGNDSNNDTIELLELLIETFDSKRNQTKRYNPVKLLKELIEESWNSQADFAKEIGLSPQLISDILNYRRPFSKNTGSKLAKFFAMKETAFLAEYNFKKERSKQIKRKRTKQEQLVD